MTETFNNRRDNAHDERAQDEVITARAIREDNPSLTWTECLKAAKECWDKHPAL